MLGDEPVSEEEAKRLIDMADLNHDGKIDFYGKSYFLHLLLFILLTQLSFYTTDCLKEE